MEYEEIKLIKQSEKSTVYLVREKDGEQIFIRKILKGRHNIYGELQNCPHPYLPKLYEVTVSETDTTIIEEYIEGQSLGSVELSEKQFLKVVKELCAVLEFLHEKGIIHRDIKPSNIILTKDEQIRLIDFDAARMPKDDLEQDTKLLGTRGYAPPEQYGFAQTDERTDIYSLGITLKQLLGKKAGKLRYKRIISKCTDLNPEKRYQSVRQVKRAFFHRRRNVLCGFTVIFVVVLLWKIIPHRFTQQQNVQSENTELVVLPTPDNPHWDGETGMVSWGNVPESGAAGEAEYYWRLYRRDTATPPDPEVDMWEREGDMRGNILQDDDTFEVTLSDELWENGFYYFEVCAVGDGIHYTDSSYVMSDAFEYTGEFAPSLPTPTGLKWKMVEGDEERLYFATWSNFDDYEDLDSFNVTVYDKSGEYVMNNILTKEQIKDRWQYGGMRIRKEFLSDEDGEYRFTVQAYTSRPNEYKSSPMPDPVPEEYFSPWLSMQNKFLY